MGIYKVAICRSAFNHIEVEAGSEEEARDKACDIFESPDFDHKKFDFLSEDYDALVTNTPEDK